MAKKYLLIILSGTLISIGFVSLVNLLIDPYWYYRIVEIKGVNAVKPEFPFFERDFKPAIALKENPTTVILGDSFSEIGLDPGNAHLNGQGEKAYNLGLIGSGWDTTNCLFKWLNELSGIRTVILGINGYKFPETNCNDPKYQFAQVDHFKALLSLSALQSSFSTLIHQSPENATHTREGLFFFTRRKSNVRQRFTAALHPFARCQDETREPSLAVYQYNFSGIKTMVAQAIRKKRRLVILIHPRHALTQEAQYRCRRSPEQRWKKLELMVNNLEEITRGTGTEYELWDFSVYNAYLGELPVTGKQMTYWQDPAHYNPELGTLFLDDIFGSEPPRLGFRINARTLETFKKRWQEGRDHYLKAHPEFIRQLNEMVGAPLRNPSE